MKKLFRLAMVVIMSLTFTSTLMAQVTTGSLMGLVKDSKGDALPGAFVKVTHAPSGTVYTATTQSNGRYTIPAVRVGQDYEIEVVFIGQDTQVVKGITVNLGDPTVVNIDLTEESSMLEESVIIAKRKTAATEKTGAVTSVDRESIANLPTISRSINDFTRLTPQSKGNSFAGRDGRYNYITIDGSAFNNSFGLSGQSRNLPGGDAQPISLDAIEEISVSIAPYDIRQSNFTGASVNAVTKSGTNKFTGSAYTFQRPESFTGTRVGDEKLDLDKRSTQTWGASLGGPIIKNKLFFFANFEFEESKYPSTPWKPSTDGNADNTAYISRTKIDDLKTLKKHLEDNYGYNPGGWDFGQFSSRNNKILARLDWNISQAHKLSVRYNQVISENDVLPNSTSGPTRLASGRIGENGFAFTNTAYGFENTVRSITAELNSVFQSRFSNKLLVTYTNIRDKRTSNSDLFPFVDIMEGGQIYTSFGYELFTYNNDVKNRTWSIVDNFTAYLGAHTVTGGLSFERMYFGNAYLRYGTSYYRYNSMADFINNATPALFSYTYGYNNTDPYSELTFGLGAMYFQDEWQVNPSFKLTGGIRFELPFYFNDLDYNPEIPKMAFANGQTIDVGSWPDKQLLVSPRVGFNWDVLGDRSLQVRGGTGIFTGRLPFVWFTNQPTNSGMLQNTVDYRASNLPAGFGFNPDWKQQLANYPNLFPNNPGTGVPSTLAMVDKDFKMPQVWRTSIAVDYTLPWDMIFTLEGIYSKDINAVMQTNINEKDPTLRFAGSDNRPYYDTYTSGSNTYFDNRLNNDISSAMILGNTSKGYQYSITAQLSKAFSHGLTGMVAYTYNVAKDLSSNPGDQAASAWNANVAVGSLNNPGLSYSNFSVPHRVVGSLSYKFGFVNSSASTTVSLFYEGAAQGRLSYVYANDMNGDGNSSDLMYIPKNRNDIVFKDKGVGMSAQEQEDAFFKFLEQDDYLRNNRGEYAERFGTVMPWRNQFDLKLLQEFVMNNKYQTKLQLSLDILNIGNLINSKWGMYKSQISGSYDNMTLLRYEGVSSDGKPMFSLNGVSKALDFHTSSYKDVLTYGSTWSMQLGLRLVF